MVLPVPPGSYSFIPLPFRRRTRLLPILRLLRRLGDALLPGCCALCGADAASPICNRCRSLATGSPATQGSAHLSRCRQCAVELTTPDPLCGRCLSQPPAFDASFAATRYAPPVDLLVHALKFRAQLPLANAFAQWLLETMAAQASVSGDLLIAVPLSAERLAERGFNQAQEIARPLARAMQLPLLSDACVRVRDTLPQSGLALADRRDNMRGAFAVMDCQAIAGKRLLVVDDVMTTGHTLDALAACLKRHGAASVTNLVFARTPPH